MLNKLYCFWTAENVMPEARWRALDSLSNTGLEVCFITAKNVKDWELDDRPYHPAYPYLSAIHRADYLRVYFMHHYGGGYSDIKHSSESWLPALDSLIDSDKWGVGYREIGPKGVAFVRSWRYFVLLANWKFLLGNGAYIFKPKTEFTSEWLCNTEKVLDRKLIELQKNPANHPEDFNGKSLRLSPDTYSAKASAYPLRWSEMLGDVFHPLCYKYRKELLNILPQPDFYSNYD